MKALIAPILICASSALAQGFQPIPTLPVAQFLDSLGVNTHLEYSDGTYSRAGEDLFELQYLGIQNVRNGAPDPSFWQPFGQDLAAMQYLMGSGIKFDLLANCNVSLSQTMEQIDSLAKAHPAQVVAVEGPNEINNGPCSVGGGANEGNAESFQAQLYSAVHNDANLSGVPVYDFTGGAQTSSLTHRADFGNNHPYPYPSRNLLPYARMRGDYTTSYAGDFPRVITEDGYHSLPDGSDGMDELSQAVGQLQVYMDGAAFGAKRTYLYELKDAYSPGTPPFSTYGLFSTVTGLPKQAAVAIHNLTFALSYFLPQGPTAGTAAISASMTGAPEDSHALALTDAGGGVTVFLWRDISPWSVIQQQTVMPQAVPVGVKLSKSCSFAYTFDPLHNKFAAVSANAGAYTIGEEPYPIGLYCAR